MSHMKTTTLPEQPDAKSPAGADIRFVRDDVVSTVKLAKAINLVATE